MDAAMVNFITDTYVPELLKNRRILSADDPNDYTLASCTVLPVTSDGTFMLSVCNRVKVGLKKVPTETDASEDITQLDLVIKVSASLVWLTTFLLFFSLSYSRSELSR